MIDLYTLFGATYASTKQWLDTHSIIAWIILFIVFILWLLQQLFSTVPQFQQFKANVLIPFAKKREHGRRVKHAIKADIEARINSAIMAFGTQLPVGWINKIKIEWVEHETKEDFFNDGEMVLRLRPLEDQSRNLVRAGYAFLQQAFFPHSKNVIPKEHRDASILFTGYKIMIGQGDSTKKIYEDIILEPEIQKNKRVLPIIKRFENLDARGFFMGAFLREVQAVAIGARFDPTIRHKMREEASALIEHMEDFIARYPEHNIPDMSWSRKGPITNYGFILVACPLNVETNNVSAFVNRARDCLKKGIDRLYIFGAEDNRVFTNNVVRTIAKEIPEYKIVECFDLSHDYRGKPGGFGALLVAAI